MRFRSAWKKTAVPAAAAIANAARNWVDETFPTREAYVCTRRHLKALTAALTAWKSPRMGDVAKILSEKGGDVLRISGDATVFEAVSAMVDANVGAILVTDADERIAGIFTERDYLRRIAVEGRTSRDTLVREVMSSPVIAVGPETSVEEAMALMTDRRIRHAPVTEGGRLVGIVSIGDLVRQQSQEQSFTIRYLTEYIGAR
jgi:CBS domain-containing protein